MSDFITSEEFEEGLLQYRMEQIMTVLEDSEAMLAEGFEKALVGHTHGMKTVAVYDYDMCVHILMERDGMTCTEAIEFMDFNVVGAHGDNHPVFVTCMP